MSGGSCGSSVVRYNILCFGVGVGVGVYIHMYIGGDWKVGGSRQ